MPMSTAIPEASDLGAQEAITATHGRTEGLPAWLASNQKAGWQAFLALPWPKRTDEAWRFSSLGKLTPEAFRQAEPVSAQLAEKLVSRSRLVGEASGRMVFANGRLITRETLGGGLDAKGVVWLPLEEAAAKHAELLEEHFMVHEAVLGGQKFAALHRAHARSGMVLYVPPNTEIALPIELFHWAAGDGVAVFPHTLIVAGAHSSVTVVEYFANASESDRSFSCGVNDLHLGPGARVCYVSAQCASRFSQTVAIHSATVSRDAHASQLALSTGGTYSRWESVSRLVGQGGRSDMLSATIAQGEQEFDQRTFQIHQQPQTSSDLLYKNALDGKAKTIFSGLIRVEPGAHKTDAYQKVRNLLLSDEAEANSAPGLEIEADDVRCTHGATSGQIEPDELFYLLSRGIPRETAQRLIVEGFLQEALDKLHNPSLSKSFSQLLFRH